MTRPSRSHAVGTALVLLVFAQLAPAAGRAENLLANPGFDDGLRSWRVDFPQVHFAGPDAGFDPESGSMQVDVAIGDPQGAVYGGGQCVPVEAGAPYRASALAALLGPDHPHAAAFLEVAWFEDAACAGAPLATERLAETEERYWFWIELRGAATAPLGAAGARFRIGAEKREAGGDFPVYALFDQAALELVTGGSGSCTQNATSLCLGDGRFRVTASWTNGPAGGAGYVHPLTADTGAFWFFDAANLEVVVKVLDGCAANGRFWVYAGGLTDLGVRLAVEDTVSGATAVYESPAGEPFHTVADSGALAGCP